MKFLDWLSLTLVIIGALNWGLVGFFDFNLITAIFHGGLSFIARIIFALVGLAGLYSLSIYGRLDATYEAAEPRHTH
ncbi:DUF378 domain-containing protein [Lachnospiraceae bacterium NSJ-143]|nr:DUF378 domain-containing protein [Lachnospiraceae bacterium NSJ-143]